jgi:uncharacterized membrane protein
MSLESAKKMGFAASIISVITPVIVVIAAFGLLVALFSNIFSTVTAGTTPALTRLAVMGGVLGLIIVGGIVALVGYILFMISMYRLSQYYNEKAIFKNVLNALIIQIVFSVVLMASLYAYIFSLVGTLIPSATTSNTSTGIVWNFIIAYAVVALISWIVSIYSGLLYKRAFYALAEKSNVDSFHTTGVLYLIGSALNLLGGTVLIWIAWIFAATSYQKLAPMSPTATVSPAYYSPTQPVTPQGPTKQCPTCGTENSPDSFYCAKCGHQL